MRALEEATTFLFVPGTRPDRFATAAASGADVVVLDLEDAVAPADKDHARGHVDDWLAAGNRGLVRVNAPGTAWFDADVAVAARHGAGLMVPKADDPRMLEALPPNPLLPLIETASGVERVAEISAVAHVRRLAFGSVDLATELGVRHGDRLPLAYARSRLVLSSRAAGKAAPVDGVTTSLHDPEALAEDVRMARRLGFGAKLCIHPKQLAAVAAGFAPTAAEVEWARRVAAAEPGVAVVDGEMVDRPLVERARRILNTAQRDPARP